MTNKTSHITLELRCPKCSSTNVRTRLRTGNRICYRCGYVGEPEQFEVKKKS